MKTAGIYIHVPFCVAKCKYCNFYSETFKREAKELYLAELGREIENNAVYAKDKVIKTVYFGGGTPGLLEGREIRSVMDKIHKFYSCDIAESTIEINPNTSENIAEYHRAGINRISVGVQSLDDRILVKLGRLHTSKEATECLDYAGKFFDNISADLILGVDKKQNVERDLEILLPKVKHISAYMLKLEDGTPLKMECDLNKTSVADEDEVIAQYDFLAKKCSKNGFHRYEISNFSLPGYQSMHNKSYWKMYDYFGFGPSAHSYIDGVRYYNTPSLKDYLDGKNSAWGRQETERDFSLHDEKEEFIMLGLRTVEGIDISEFNRRFNADFYHEYSQKIKKLGEYLILSEDYISIRPEYFLVQNAIISELI